MANAIFQRPIVDETGRALPGATLAVYDETGTTLQTIYDASGSTITNPVVADANGYAFFYAAPGKYYLRVTFGPSSTTYPDVLVGTTADDGVSTLKILDANVTEAKIATGAVTEDKIGAAAVTTAKIADAAVTSDKVDSSVATAADLVGFSGGTTVYADTTAGLAGTTEGDYFNVPSDVESELLILYRHDAGPTATEIGRSSSSSVVAALNQEIFPVGFDLAPWNFAVTVDGQVILGEDSDGEIFKFDQDTHVVYESTVSAEQQVFSQNKSTGDTVQLSASGSNNSSPFIDSGHAVYITDRDATYVGGLMAAPLSGGEEVAYIGRKRLACWGDSQTAGTGAGAGEDYPTVLGSLLGWPVYNGGIGSQTSYQIAARQGGVPATVEVTGESIPASGPVTITAISQDLLFNVGTSMTGTLAGIEGTLDRVSASEYTFTRSASGDATSCPAGTPFIPTQNDQYRDDLTIICMGRNDDAWGTDHMFALAGMLPHLTSLNKRFVLLGQMHGTAGNVVARSNITRNWDAQYPDNFIDINTALQAYGNGSAGDNDDIANGLVPGSLRADTIPHLNADGYAALAEIIHNFMIEKGWA